MFKYTNQKLGELLVNSGVLSEENLEKALREQKGTKKRLGEILVENKYLNQSQIIESLVVQLGIPYLDLGTVRIDPAVVRLIPETIAKMNAILPVVIEGNELTLAVADPLEYSVINDMGIYTGMNIKTVISERDKILDKLSTVFATENVMEAAREIAKDAKFKNDDEDIESLEGDQPIIRLVNMMIEQAIIMQASDIHVEPGDKKMRIRFRIDGKLQDYMEAEGKIMPSVVSRIKFIGGMNIAEKRTPQDGRITYKSKVREVDLRISVLPCVHGEKVVIRLMSTLGLDLTKDKLGFLPENLEKFNKMLRHPHGIILLTGPTGSGKTTTLYTALREKKRGDINIITVEDPVEAMIDGITQVQVNPLAGLTFASALRSMLRQDPDVVMIGEIRDEETADIAARVAITGHLVLSTLHTNDAASVVVRLVDMGVAPYMVSASLIGVISQRLVRKICPKCKKEYSASFEELSILGLSPDIPQMLHKGEGCEYCKHSGYKGRTAIHEVMPVSAAMRRAVHSGGSIDTINEIAIKEGMITLRENMKRTVISGITTVAEMVELFAEE